MTTVDAPRYTAEGVRILERADFLDNYWQYRAGEHVTILGPTDCGKTTLGYQLLERSTTPRLPALVLVMKPRDKVAAEQTKRLGYKRVRSWSTPPPWERRQGYTVWPRHSFDPDKDNPMLYWVFRDAILDSYKRGRRIVFGDEVYGLAAELGLTKELVTVWSRGRSMGCGLWAASQKPTHIPLWAYSQAAHLYLYRDPDKRARDRFSEIGGVDPDLVKVTVMGLDDHECLYIRRAGARMCVVAA